MRHLHELGHRRIATITGLLDTRPGAERLRGYRSEVQALGLAYRDEYVAYGDFYVDSGHRAMAELLALAEPPTAVFAASDLMALGRDPRRRRGRAAACRGRLGRRLRRHPARRPRPSAADHGAPGQGRPGGRGRTRAHGADRRRGRCARRRHPARRAGRPRVNDIAPVRGLARGWLTARRSTTGAIPSKIVFAQEESNMRRKLATASWLVAVVLALVVSACGGSSSDDSKTTASKPAAKRPEEGHDRQLLDHAQRPAAPGRHGEDGQAVRGPDRGQGQRRGRRLGRPARPHQERRRLGRRAPT